MPLIKIAEVGRIKRIKKNIAVISGLSCFMNGQLLRFSSGGRGIVVGFDIEDITAFILDDECKVRVGEEVYSEQEEFRIPVGDGFIGRIVNALAEPVDGKGPIEDKCQVSGIRCHVSSVRCQVSGVKCHDTLTHDTLTQTKYYPVFREAAATSDRSPFNSPLETGTKIIDAVIPIAKGQRQLIIGNRMTGKTTIAVDAVLNQKEKGTICIYCCIGKSFSSLSKIVAILKEKEALDYTIVVASLASAATAQQYIAPYSACALGEYFMYKGLDVLVIFDDLTKHAWVYRELSLLLERPPGREAYPGDIYYVHSQLMERAGKLKEELNGGSMTFLAVADTVDGDVTGLIPSNLVSMSDGQVYLSAALFTENVKPAVDLLMSFLNTGSRAQHPVLKILAKDISMEYARYKELLQLTRIKSNLLPETENIIHRGKILNALFCQDKNNPVSIAELIVLLYAFDRKILDALDLARVNSFKNEIWGYVTMHNPKLAEALAAVKELTSEVSDDLDEALAGYFARESGQEIPDRNIRE